MKPFKFHKSSPIDARHKSRECGHLFIFLAILCIHFIITYFLLYERYVLFEMFETTDSAAYMQVSWSIFNGTPFTTSMQDMWVSYSPHNFLGDQLMFTLVLFSPFLLFTTSCWLFILFQTLIISVGALILYQYANMKLENKWLPLLIVVGFLFNPATYSSYLHFGFRIETLFIPFIFAIFYFVECEKKVLATIFVILTLLTKHNAIPIIFTLGLYYIIISRKNWRFGLLCLLLSLIYYVVGIELIMAHFQQKPTAHFKHFSQFGDSPLLALVNLILNPSKIISMVSRREILHALEILFPAGFLSVINPIFWISSFQLFMLAILDDYQSISCGWHWALVVPFLFLGMTSSIGWIINRAMKGRVVTYGVIILLSIGSLFHITTFSREMIKARHEYYFKIDDVKLKKISDSLGRIEDNASVMASGRLLWHLYDRDEVYTSRIKFYADVDYIAILSPLESPRYRNIDKHLIIEAKKKLGKARSKLDTFDMIYNDGNLLIFKNKMSSIKNS